MVDFDLFLQCGTIDKTIVVGYKKSMVQLKYFGDSRDYFKYDLITYLLKSGVVSNYIFIPMLTNPRPGREGNKKPKYIEGKSPELLSFIDKCHTKDLSHWERWLSPHVNSYTTVKPVNEVFFVDSDRESYWQKFENISKGRNALIFLDPDTGIETGTPWYLRKRGREKYILNSELSKLAKHLDDTSVLMIYQHLPNNKLIHKQAVLKKLNQAVHTTNCKLLVAYREDDLAFIFIMKKNAIYIFLRSLLEGYHKNSGHVYKSIHFQLYEPEPASEYLPPN